METPTKTSIALEHFRAGRLQEALAIFSTFRIGFNRDERAAIIRAHEILGGHAAFYQSLGLNTEQVIQQATTILSTKYPVEV